MNSSAAASTPTRTGTRSMTGETRTGCRNHAAEPGTRCRRKSTRDRAMRLKKIVESEWTCFSEGFMAVILLEGVRVLGHVGHESLTKIKLVRVVHRDYS